MAFGRVASKVEDLNTSIAIINSSKLKHTHFKKNAPITAIDNPELQL